MAQPRIRKLFAGGDDGKARRQRLRQLALDAIETAAGGVEEDAALPASERDVGVRGDHHVGSGRVDHVAELAADAGRIEVERSDDFHFGFGEGRAGNQPPDGAEPHQNDLDRHECLPLFAARWPAYSPCPRGPYSQIDWFITGHCKGMMFA